MTRDEMTNSRSATTVGSHFSTGQKLGVITGFVAMITLAAMIIIWSWSPAYKILFSSLTDREAIKVLNVLYSNGFDAKLDESSGAILVPASDIHIARIKLSNLGLPQKSSLYSSLQEDAYNRGLLLNDSGSVRSHIQYTQRIEEILSQRIERILEPLVGVGSVRAQVTINSGSGENVSNSKNQQLTRGQEIPLSNSDTPDKRADNASSLVHADNSLSITVLVNDKPSIGDNGDVIVTPRTSDELNKITGLIQAAVGYNSKRGDSINVVTTKFKETLPDLGVDGDTIENIWFQEWVKKSIGVILVVILISFAFWRLLKMFFGASSVNPSESVVDQSVNPHVLAPSELARKNFNENLHAASLLAKNDPKLVAQIMKNWVNADGR